MIAQLAVTDYGIPFTGPAMSITELRDLGRETLEVFRIDTAPKQSGRRSDGSTPYLEGWAQRYWRAQQSIERGRLRQGKAKHRAHRDPIQGKPQP